MGENPRGLYVAAYGSDPTHGLYRFAHVERGWQGSLLSVVDRLSALAWHPTLPVIYGVSGSEVGRVHAWNVSGSTASTLTDAESGGLEPCHVAVSPDGRRVVVTNYSSSNLMVWDVAADGSLVNAVALHLTGSGRDPERQEAAHPHQAVFESGELRVVDLGTDAVRTFDWTGSAELRLTGGSPVPAGTGPRHMVQLADGATAVSGELTSTLLVGDLASVGGWSVYPSTTVDTADGVRNYPGDIRASRDGHLVYLANRGNDTIATFRVVDTAAALVSEIDSGVTWPQHLAVVEDDLVVAGRGSSQVVALTLVDGVPSSAPRVLFDCPGAAWILPEHASTG